MSRNAGLSDITQDWVEQITDALGKKDCQHVELRYAKYGPRVMHVDGEKIHRGKFPEFAWALNDLRDRQLAAGVWPWFEARLVVDRDVGVVELELDDWQVKPDWLDVSDYSMDAAIPSVHAEELMGDPRAVDRVPVWIKELLATDGSWDLVSDSLTVDRHAMETGSPNFPSDAAVVEARAAREVERVRVEAAGGVWRDERLTLPSEVSWDWPGADPVPVLDVKEWRAAKKRWQSIARSCRGVRVMRSAPKRVERLAPVVRPAVKVFAGVEIFGWRVGFLDAEVAGTGASAEVSRGSHQPLWWDRLDGLTCVVGPDGSLGPVMWFDEEQLLATSVASPVELFDRCAEWVEQSWPQIQQAAADAVLDPANAVRPQDRRVERRAMEDDLGEQLFAEFITGLAVSS